MYVYLIGSLVTYIGFRIYDNYAYSVSDEFVKGVSVALWFVMIPMLLLIAVGKFIGDLVIMLLDAITTGVKLWITKAKEVNQKPPAMSGSTEKASPLYKLSTGERVLSVNAIGAGWYLVNNKTKIRVTKNSVGDSLVVKKFIEDMRAI